jgi:hypothetical protein
MTAAMKRLAVRKAKAALRRAHLLRTGAQTVGTAAGLALAQQAGSYVSRKVAYKKGVSYTGTKTKKKKTTSMPKSSHNDLSVQHLGSVVVGAQSKRNPKTYNSYRQINQHVFESEQGRQVTDFADIFLTRQNLVGEVNTSRFDRYRWGSDPWEITANQLSTGSYLYPPSVERGNVDLYIGTVHSELNILGMVNSPQIVTVRYLTPKTDYNPTPINTWNEAIVAENSGTNNGTLADTLATPDYGEGGVNINDVGLSPISFRDFNKTWSLLKSFTFLLQPGDQKNISATFIMNKCISKNEIDEKTATFIKHTTVIPMITVRAGLVGITPNSLTDATEVSYAAAKIGVLHNYVVKIGNLPISERIVNRTGISIQVNNTTDAKQLINDEDAVVNIEEL